MSMDGDKSVKTCIYNNNGKRKHRRYEIMDDKSIKIFITYMGKPIKSIPVDISMGGIGLIFDNLPSCIIDGTTLIIHFKYDDHHIKTRTRVVYSFKTGERFRSRRYGVEFLHAKDTDLYDVIVNNCLPAPGNRATHQ